MIVSFISFRFFSIVKKIEQYFNFFLLNAVYLNNPAIMKKKMKQYWKLEIQMIFALRESLARSDLAKGMSMAEKTVSVPAMTRKHVQKPGNISE